MSSAIVQVWKQIYKLLHMKTTCTVTKLAKSALLHPVTLIWVTYQVLRKSRQPTACCLKRGVDFLKSFVRSSGYNSLNSQSVYTLGIYVHSATRSAKAILTPRLVTEWMSVCVCVRQMGGGIVGDEVRRMMCVQSDPQIIWLVSFHSFQRWHPVSGRSKLKSTAWCNVCVCV